MLSTTSLFFMMKWQHSFTRSGISGAHRGIDLLANKSRKKYCPSYACKIPSTPDITGSPHCITDPVEEASKSELLARINQIQAAYLQLHEQSTTKITELQSHQAELRAAQEGIVSGRLRHTQEQLEKRHKSRSTVKVPLSGDVTREDN